MTQSTDRPAGPAKHRGTVVLRWVAAVFFVLAGLNHFRNPDLYRRIIPPGFPNPPLLVVLSGLFEIAGGLGLLPRRLRRPAGLGLIALLIAVFPANLYMARHPEAVPEMHIPRWLLWVRLPFQAVVIAWIWGVSRPTRPATDARALGA